MSETLNILAKTSDGDIEGRNALYPTARSTSFNANSGDDDFKVGQAFHDSTYFVYRGFLAFDIPSDLAGVILLSAKLQLVSDFDESSSDEFDVEIVSQNWSGNIDANREADYDGCLAGTLDVVWRNTAGLAINTPYQSPALDLSRIIPGATTYYSLRSNRDRLNSGPSGYQDIWINAVGYRADSYWPTLVLEFDRVVKAATFF